MIPGPKQASERGNKAALFVLILLIALAFLGYGRTLSGYFLSDDVMIGHLYPDGRHVSWRPVFDAFHMDWRGLPDLAGYYRPFVVVSHAIDLSIWGLNPTGFHITNVLLHAFNAFFVYCLANRILGRGYTALCAAAGFVLLPLHAESVSWISGRTDVLCTTFCLLSILNFVAFRQSASRGRLTIAIATLIMAMMTKETAVSVPFILVAFDLTSPDLRMQGSFRRLIAVWTLLFGLLAVYACWRKFIFGTIVAGRGEGFFSVSPSTLLTFVSDLAWDLRLFLLPLNQSVIAGRELVFHAISLVGVAMLAIGLHRNLTHRTMPWRGVFVVTCIFFASLAPIFNAFRVHPSLMGSRMMYFPSVWLCLLVAALAAGRTFSVRSITYEGYLAISLILLVCNQSYWKRAGDIALQARDVYAATFGEYAGEPIEGLPSIFGGAYLGLYNASVFCRPFILEPPNTDGRMRYRAVYDPEKVRVIIELDDSVIAHQQLMADRQHGQWLWGDEENPLEIPIAVNCSLKESEDGVLVYEATTNDPILLLSPGKPLVPHLQSGDRETIYVEIRSAHGDVPELFWVTDEGENYCGERRVVLRPAHDENVSSTLPQNGDGFVLYLARLDERPDWPGLASVRELRLDPMSSSGAFTIRFLNLVQRGVQ